MNEELYTKMDELFSLLDKNIYLNSLEKIKKGMNQEILNLINEYRLNPTIKSKKKLYANSIYKEYLHNETEVNYLIMAINQKFRRKKSCM